MPTTHLQVTEYEAEEGRVNEQYRTTVPKDLAEFFGMGSDTTLEWSVGSASDKIEIKVKND